MKRFVLLSVVALVSLNACGDDTKVAATATEGDEFCTLAQVAADDHEVLEDRSTSPIRPQLKVELERAPSTR